MRPKPRERILTYYTRLREQAYGCDFNETCEDRILEHLIQTVRNTQLIQKCLRKEWTLFQFLQEAQKAEEIREQMCCMGHWQQGVLKACGYCGLSGVHPKGWACPAFGKRCYRCHKIDHFAVVCKTKLERKYNKFRKYKHESEYMMYMGDDTQKNNRNRIDNLNDNIMPKTVGHLIVNHLKKSETLENKDQYRGSNNEEEPLSGKMSVHHQGAARESITKHIEYGTKQEIKILQQEVDKWKSNYKLLREELVNIQRELCVIEKDNHSQENLKELLYCCERGYI